MEDEEMKKKVLVAVLFSVFVLAAFSSSAFALWHVCTISAVGSTDIGNILTVTDTASPAAFPANTQFVIPFTIPYANQMLAGALTSLANSMTVTIFTSPDSSGGIIYALYSSK